MTQFNQITKEVKRSTFRFSQNEITLGDNGENAKTAPVKLIALSGKPFDTFYWGRCVQDLNGMTVSKKRIAIDLEHCDPIGYINRFDVIDNQLVLSGAITPVTEDAKDVLALLQAGVPYEASIDFSPSHADDLIIEQYQQGMVNVNGQMFEAPLTVFRKWTLRAVAICKSGADNQTETTLQTQSANELINVIINTQQNQQDNLSNSMTSDNTQTEKVSTETVPEVVNNVNEPAPVAPVAEAETPIEAIAHTIEKTVEAVETIAEAVEKTVEDVKKIFDDTKQTILPVEPTTPTIVDEGLKVEKKEPEQVQAEVFKQYLQSFGTDKASEYFAQGLTMVDAKDKHYGFMQSQLVAKDETIQALQSEVEMLKGRLEKKSFKPVDFEQSITVGGDLWGQYQQIKDPAEKTLFYRKHKKEMNKR